MLTKEKDLCYSLITSFTDTHNKQDGDGMSGELILVVDDEPTIVEVVELYLKREGYQVITAADGLAALQAAEERRPDLIVLDLMLPGLNGLEVTRQLRLSGHIPIIMLTARGEETDRVVGLELGADDYVTKPFSPREVVARVKAVLRRMAAATTAATATPDAPVRIVFGSLRVDPLARAVTLDGQPINLTVREYDLLFFLMRHPGQVFTREQLLDHVWGYTFASDMNTVTVHIRRLREKIEHDPATPQLLQTVWGVGYKLERP
jgi:two-component system, OmpR family, response regulator ResD